VLSYLGNSEQYKGVAKVTAAISSSPLVRVVNPPPAPIYFVLKNLAAPLIPWYHYSVGLDPKGISRDSEQVKRYVEDPLVKDTATLATCK
jgi:alpha-beta hydrolase superfamily lysophospholipase